MPQGSSSPPRTLRSVTAAVSPTRQDGGGCRATSSTSRTSRRATAAARVLRGVTLGVDEGDRIGIVGRNGDGKSTLLRLIAGVEDARRRRAHARRRRRRSRCSARATSSTPPARSAPSWSAAAPTTSGRPTPRFRSVLDGLLGGVALDALPAGPRHADRAALGRRAAAHRAGAAAARRAGAAAARRADQPPRRRGRRLARAPPRRAPRRAAGRHPRPLVPRRGLHRDVGGRRRRRPPVRGRLRGLRARARRARPAGRRPRGAPPQPAAQGAGVAAPRAAGAHVQAEVPHRRRQRADRRRARAARHAPSCCASPPRGWATRCSTPSTCPSRSARGACCATSPGGSGPGDRVALVGVNGSGKTTLLRLLAGELAPTRAWSSAARPCGSRYLSQDTAEIPGDLRVLESLEAVRGARDAERRPGDHRRPAVRPLRLPRRPRADARPRPLRRRAAAAAAHAAADGGPERPAARRADQRPRHRHADRAGGPARRLARHARRRQPRPLLRRARLRRRPRARPTPAGCGTCPAGSTSTSAAPRGGRGGARRPRPPRRRGAPPAGAVVRAARKEVARLERALEQLAEREAALHEDDGRRRHRPRPPARSSRPSSRPSTPSATRLEAAWLEASEALG